MKPKAVRRYGYLAVGTPWTRVTYNSNSGYEADVNAFASAPEYGRGMVIANGFKIKKDGTRGRQRVSPVLHLTGCPDDVQAAFAAAGYRTAVKRES